jgi:hypothetical protein
VPSRAADAVRVLIPLLSSHLLEEGVFFQAYPIPHPNLSIFVAQLFFCKDVGLLIDFAGLRQGIQNSELEKKTPKGKALIILTCCLGFRFESNSP